MAQQGRRAQYGSDFTKHQYAIAFRIIKGDFDFRNPNKYPTGTIPNTTGNVKQIVYCFSEVITSQFEMAKGEYYIVCTTYDPGELGAFQLSVYSDCESIKLECSEQIGEEVFLKLYIGRNILYFKSFIIFTSRVIYHLNL